MVAASKKKAVKKKAKGTTASKASKGLAKKPGSQKKETRKKGPEKATKQQPSKQKTKKEKTSLKKTVKKKQAKPSVEKSSGDEITPTEDVVLNEEEPSIDLSSKFAKWKQEKGSDQEPDDKGKEGAKGIKGLFNKIVKKAKADKETSAPSAKASIDEAKQEKGSGDKPLGLQKHVASKSSVSEKETAKKKAGGSASKVKSNAEEEAKPAEGIEAESEAATEEKLDRMKDRVRSKLSREHKESKPKKEIEVSTGQEGVEILKTYEFSSKDIPITINILRKRGEFVPIYDLKIAKISKHTEIFLEKIRKELIREVNLGIVDITDLKKTGIVEERFSETIVNLLNKYFPDIDEETMDFLTSYLIQKSLGLGKLELLRDDPNLEEIAINSADEPIWVYSRHYGWVKTTVFLESDDQTRHFASIIGRKVGRQLTVLEPLLDANLDTGDRINATLMPISNRGNTITLRRFASKPWTITDLIRSKTMSPETASLVWLGIQYELSLMIAGGTASGKTSTMNALCNFFPPNHRIISIEDTREIQLPSFLHWLPMVTRLPNAEGKGEVGMLHLLVNALRQRPDRILVGEVRRKKEAEVLFEAIHTGHSVYATFHANNAHEAIMRLTSPPIEVPLAMLPAISMILVQYRNRRSGLRRTFQIAEILEDGSPNVILQYDARKDMQVKDKESKSLMQTLTLYTGMTEKEIKDSIAVKSKILNWMVKHSIDTVDTVGRVMAEYYTNYDNLMKFVNRNKPFTGQ